MAGKRSGFKLTPPTSASEVAVIFRIDKKDFIKGSKQAAAQLEKFANQAAKGGRAKGVSLTVQTLDTGVESVSVYTARTIEGGLNQATKEWGKRISATGKEFFKKVIRTAPNRRKGPGRYETGRMFRAVRGRTEDTVDFTTSMIGWNNVYYRYFSFQEEGTSNGPSPMRAVPQTANYISQQFKSTFPRVLKSKIDKIK
jgi:hypothetical protein